MAHQVQQSLVVPASLAATWTAVSQMGAVADWHPNVAKVDVLTEQTAGVGASRRVEFHDGNNVVETVIEEANESFTSMQMSEMGPLRNPVVTIATNATPTGETEVTLSIRYEVRYGPIGWLLSNLVMKGMFRKVFRAALAGLAYNLETGKLVTDAVPSAAA